MRYLIFFSILFLSAVLPVFGQTASESMKGTPFIQNFSTADYKAGAINYAVEQDARGIIYVANNRGLLEYDGSTWRLYTLPSQSPVYDLAIDSVGRIFVGGDRELGYFFPDSNGHLVYNSLVSEQIEVGQVLQVFLSEANVYFLDRLSLFYFDGKDNDLSALKQDKEEPLFKAYPFKDKFYINTQFPSLLFKKEGETEEMNRIPFNPISINNYAAGQLLLTSEKGEFYLLDEESFEIQKQSFSASPFFEQNKITSVFSLPDDNYAIGTRNGGMSIMNKEGELLYLVNTDSGLQNDFIRAIYQDKRKNLWLSTNNGISLISFEAPFSIFEEQLGVEGAVISSIVFNNYLYVGTRQGLFFKPWESSGNPYTDNWGFVKIPNLSSEVFQLESFEGVLVAATGNGLYSVLENNVTLIDEDMSSSLTQLGEKLFVSSNSSFGIKVFKKSTYSLELIETLKGSEDLLVKKLISDAQQNQLWLAANNEVVVLKLNEELNEILSIQKLSDFRGIQKDRSYKPQKVGNEIWVNDQEGSVLSYRSEKGDFTAVTYLKKYSTQLKNIQSITIDTKGNLWFTLSFGLAVYSKEKNALEIDLFNRFTNQPLYFINHINDTNILIGSPQGLIHFNPALGKLAQDQSQQKLVTLIRKVEILGEDSVVFNGTFNNEQGEVVMQASQQHKVLPWERKSLRFEVASPWFSQSDRTQYRFYLKNFDKDWGEWQSSSFIEYTNLPQGVYTFTAQSKNIYGVISAEATFDFTIEAPWFYRWWAYFFYLLMAGLIYWVGFKINSIRLRQRNKELENLVEKRTVEISEMNEEISTQNKQLAELNEEKNDLIGVLAHDMRNPLHQIKGLVELSEIRFPNLESELKEYHGYMKQGVDRLNTMITQILDLKAIESGKINMNLEPLNLHHLLNATADGLKAKAEKKEIELIKNLEINDYNVVADRNYLLQVFENLLSNAIKFSPKNKSIFLNLEQENGYIVAVIKDEGPGISKEDQKKLFGKFQKLSAVPTDGESSTGLGLSIVKKYVEAMDGEVWCESEIEKGAAFKVKFSIA